MHNIDWLFKLMSCQTKIVTFRVIAICRNLNLIRQCYYDTDLCHISLGGSYEFDFKEDILWLTNKEFKIFVSTKKGVYTLNNVQVLKTKNRPSIKLSPLGRELFSVGSFKISSFQVSDELNLINERNTDLNYHYVLHPNILYYSQDILILMYR